MNIDQFLTDFPLLAEAPNGVPKLREMILQLAVQGKLVPQDPDDEPASVLLENIKTEKRRLITEGKIKKQKPLSPIMQERIPYELPEEWEWTRLGELGITQTGATPPSKDRENYGKHVPFIGPGAIKNGSIDYSGEGLSEIGLIRGRLIEENSVLMVCIGGSIGKQAINDRNVTCNQQINTLTPYRPVPVKYLYWTMATSSFQSNVIGRASGSATPIINKQKWSSIPVPLPPLAEQIRIVAKVDELMAWCDDLESQQKERNSVSISLNGASLHALAAPQSPRQFSEAAKRVFDNFHILYDKTENVKELRKAILQLAVQGKLVPQDPNDEPASVLLQNINVEKARLIAEGKIKKQKPLPLIDVDEVPYELPDGWEWTSLPAIYYPIPVGRNKVKTRDLQVNGRYPVIDQGQSRVAGFINDESKLIKIPGTIIVFGDHTRAIKLIDFDFVAGADGVRILRPILLDERYFYKVLQSYSLVDRGYGRHYRILNNQQFPLPPLAEQKRVVAKVDELMALCDGLEEGLTQANGDAERLMEAVVHEMGGGA